MPVQRPAFQETTSLGAALAAGYAAGVYKREMLFAELQEDADATIFEPKLSKEDASKKCKSWQIAVKKACGLDGLA